MPSHQVCSYRAPMTTSLLVIAAGLTPIAGALFPPPLTRVAALPMSAALIWLGISLWSHETPAA